MAKKKSKSQKQRKNLKKKRKAIAQVKGQVSTKDEVLYNVALTNSDIYKDTLNKQNNKQTSKKTEKQQDNKNVIKIKKKIDNNKAKTNNNNNNNNKIIKVEKKNNVKEKNNGKVNDIVSLIFTCVLLLSFIILLIGAIRVEVFTNKEILGGVCLLGFLILIAVSYNKYISGRIFTIILVIGMVLGICKLQYTYDFFHNLNTMKYEYKKYYLVSFDTPQNVNVYSVNGKKVGLLIDNNKNVQRKLSTVVDKVNFIICDNEDMLFDSFYDSKVRALILTENEYKYLQNDSKFHSEKNLKVLYEFKVNAPK